MFKAGPHFTAIILNNLYFALLLHSVLKMKRALYIFTVMLALVLSYLGTEKHMTTPVCAQIESNTHNGESQHKHQPGQLRDHNPIDREATGTVIAESQNIMRICNSRPQRTLSGSCARSARVTGQSALSTSTHATTGMSRLSRGETAPFSTPSASDYYVIALRRLLC